MAQKQININHTSDTADIGNFDNMSSKRNRFEKYPHDCLACGANIDYRNIHTAHRVGQAYLKTQWGLRDKEVYEISASYVKDGEKLRTPDYLFVKRAISEALVFKGLCNTCDDSLFRAADKIHHVDSSELSVLDRILFECCIRATYAELAEQSFYQDNLDNDIYIREINSLRKNNSALMARSKYIQKSAIEILDRLIEIKDGKSYYKNSAQDEKTAFYHIIRTYPSTKLSVAVSKTVLLELEDRHQALAYVNTIKFPNQEIITISLPTYRLPKGWEQMLGATSNIDPETFKLIASKLATASPEGLGFHVKEDKVRVQKYGALNNINNYQYPYLRTPLISIRNNGLAGIADKRINIFE